MWLLTLTICLAADGQAECRTEAMRTYETARECIQMGRAHTEYANKAKINGVTIIFADGQCAKGTDG